MSQAEELLNSLFDDDASVYTTDDEPHIVVNSDRTITIPDELVHIAVQYDHNVETVTFDCPRYWDEHDFSTMHAYINYKRSDGYEDQYTVKNLRVDESDETIIHFEWTISRNVTKVKGNISFLVCIKTINDEGEEEPHWNSRLNNELIVDEGLECTAQVVESVPDAIESCVDRIENLEESNFLEIHPVANGVYFLDLESAGLPAVPVDGSSVTISADCSELRNILATDVVKLQIPIEDDGVVKYITAFSLATYQEATYIYQISINNIVYTDGLATTYIINVDVSTDTISVSVFKMKDASTEAN